MKEAILRLVFISFSVVLFSLCLLVLLAQLRGGPVIRTHPVLKEHSEVQLLEQIVGLETIGERVKQGGGVIGLHLYPAKNFWLVSSNLQDKTYFTKEDLKKEAFVRWDTLLKKYPKQKFFVYLHSQNPVDLFKFIKISKVFTDRLLIYSNFLKTAAWFRKEAPLMAIALSPTVLLRLNLFSRLWIEGLVPVRANFAYILSGKTRLKVLEELQQRGLVLIIDKSLMSNKDIKVKKEGQIIENTFSIKNYWPLIKIKGI